MTSNAVKDVMALFDTIKIDWSDIGLSNKPVKAPKVTNVMDRKRKHDLRQGRLEVFRVLLRRFLSDQKCREMVNFEGTMINSKAVEDYLDDELANFDFDLEAMIDMYRVYTPKPNLTVAQCVKCGYRKPICSCFLN